MDTIRYNQEMSRMNRDIRRMREQIDTLKGKLSERILERTNMVFDEVYNGGR